MWGPEEALDNWQRVMGFCLWIGTCLIWHGDTINSKYGKVYIRVIRRMYSTPVLPHRLIWAMHNKDKVKEMAGMDVSHLCNNKLCLNIAHLSLETQEINNERRICERRGRCDGHKDNKKIYPKCLLGLRLPQLK